jgi:SpoVK/Ycf46/Vps4 family AAA+-type ATPase
MSPEESYPDTLAHLKDELQRLDLLIEHAVARGKTSRGRETIAGPYISEPEVRALVSPSPAAGADATGPETNRLWERIQVHSQNIRARIDASRSQGVRLHLPRLARIFGLSPFEMDVLLICLAPEMDLKYQRLYGFLHDDATRRHASIALVQKLLCLDFDEEMRARAFFVETAPLVRYRLIALVKDTVDPAAPLPAQQIQIDAGIAGHLLDGAGLDPLISAHTSFKAPAEMAAKALTPGEPWSRIADLLTAYLAGDAQTQLVFYFSGPDTEAKRQTAETVCRRLNTSLIRTDVKELVGEKAEMEPLVSRVLREGLLQPAAVFLENCDWLWENESRTAYQLRALQELIREMGWVVFVSGKRPWPPAGLRKDQVLLEFDFPVPAYAACREIWQSVLNGGCQRADDLDLDELAATFRLTRAQIQDAVLVARNCCLLREGEGRAMTGEDLRAAARACSNQKLGAFGRKILPHYRWQDIILPPDILAQLQEFCAHARFRDRVYGEWGFDRKHSLGKGLTILFSGDSGTGKTMAAEIIAGDLGLDLYKIDLSTVVSKYIGETEKNLSRIFEEAETSNAILFFDEADALYGKRSEVKDSHDRYANIEINYLLQKLDEHEGIVILATNLSKNIDEAFVRRLQYAVAFPAPEKRQRLLIWQGVFPEQTPLADDVDIAFLAKQFVITGGSIKNIAVRAAFLAARNSGAVHMEHIVRAAKREFQKMGRLCLESEFKHYYDLVK